MYCTIYNVLTLRRSYTISSEILLLKENIDMFVYSHLLELTSQILVKCPVSVMW